MRQTKETSGLVLVVEDNRNISEMIGEYLEGRHHPLRRLSGCACGRCG